MRILKKRRPWSSRKLSEQIAIVLIVLVGASAVAAGGVVVAFYTGMLFTFRADAVAESTHRSLQDAIDRELRAGDAAPCIVEFLKRRDLSYEYYDGTRCYRAVAYRSPDKAHHVVIEIWIDASGKFIRGNVTDEQTFL